MKDWRCNTCGMEFDGSKSKLIAHVRKEHPKDGWKSCWDACGDLGDEFANEAMNTMQQRIRRLETEKQKAEEKAKAYDEMQPLFLSYRRALQIVRLSCDQALE